MSKKSSLDYEVSMPFLTGSLLQHGITASGRMVQICFYALSNGQSVATVYWNDVFTEVVYGFYALSNGQSVATKETPDETTTVIFVSMPFLTGSLLQHS